MCTERENYWIGFYKANNPTYGFNIRKAADSNIGYTHSKETIQKIAEANRRLSAEVRARIKEDKRKFYIEQGHGLELNGEIKLLKEWAEQYQISYATVHSRIKKQGWSLEKALTTPIGATRIESRRKVARKQGARSLAYNGETKLLIEWAEQFQIAKGVLSTRLERGWSPEKALTTPIGLARTQRDTLREVARKRGESLHTLNGEAKLLVEWAEQYHIRKDVLGSRLRYGWSLGEALTTPVDKSSNVSTGRREWAKEQGKGLEFNGEIRLVCEWAELYQMPKQTIYDRLALGWSLERALTTPIGGVDKKTSSREGKRKNGKGLLTFNGETKLISEWAEQYHMSTATLKHRLERKWSIEEALKTPQRGNL